MFLYSLSLWVPDVYIIMKNNYVHGIPSACTLHVSNNVCICMSLEYCIHVYDLVHNSRMYHVNCLFGLYVAIRYYLYHSATVN